MKPIIQNSRVRLLTQLSFCLLGFPFTQVNAAQPTFTYEQLKSFGNPPERGGYSRAELIEGLDGALYGTAEAGGSHGCGTVFKLNRDGSGFTVLHHFDGTTTGSFPQAALIQGTDNTLYGTTGSGGTGGVGTVFKLNPGGTGFAVLISFDGSTTGSGPQAGLLRGLDGALYGTTSWGGSAGAGTVFKLSENGSGFTVLHSFISSTTGAYPYAELLQLSDGALYGTAREGGASGHGTIFKLNPNGTGFAVLKHFDNSSTGRYPEARLIEGNNGALYGTAQAGGNSGGGTVFKVNPNGSGFTVVKNFSEFSTGANLHGRLIQGMDGALYGTASEGGSATWGTVFKLNLDGTGFTVLLNFDYYSGGDPFAGLLQGIDGALYGTTLMLGSYDHGTVFKVNTDGTGFAVLENLSNGADLSEMGGNPYAGLIQGMDRALYGTTRWGGSNDYGTVFKLNPDGTDFTVLQNFDSSTTGGYLFAGVLEGADGVLYGTANAGGSSGYGEFGYGAGTLFKLNADGTGFGVLQNLDGTTGGYSLAGLIQGTDGALYGTAIGGGGDGSGHGTVFKVNTDGTDFTVLKIFDSTTSGSPLGLMQGTDGALYGTGSGDLFKLNPDGSSFAILQRFDPPITGSNSRGALIEGLDGALYGTAFDGGSSGAGTVFKLNPDGTDFTVLLHFDGITTGGFPWAGLTQGTDGALYGTTVYGGSYDGGTVFQLNPDGTGFTVLFNFDPAATGANPFGGLLEGTDGNFYGTTVGGGENGVGTVFRLVSNTPRITALTPPSVLSSTGPFALTVNGTRFVAGSVVQWNGVNLETTLVSDMELGAAIATVPTTSDIYTAFLTVQNPDGTVSSPEAFVVTAANVASVESDVAEFGRAAHVSMPPTGTGNTAGVSATVVNSGEANPVALTAAIYSSDPSPSTAFEIDSATGVAGEFLDLQVTGADEADTLAAYFYYPTDAIESETSPTLKYYDGSAWVDVFTSGGSAPVKNTSDNLESTVSGGRFTVQFDNTSTPKITELGGTFFAVTFPRGPLGFAGFLAPIGGADATGGSFAQPLQTFKAGSTIPVKFTASRDGTAIVTGVHTLQATKYSSETTADTPIDATPQGSATTGNRFELHGSQWHFNLDTKATGLTKGIWQLVATLSDGTQHKVWIQIK